MSDSERHRTRLPAWVRARGRPLNDFPALDPAPALVNIDLQHAFVAADGVYGNPYARGVLPRINALTRAFRDIGAPVVWTRNSVTLTGPWRAPAWRYDASVPEVAAALAALAPGGPGHDLVPEAAVERGDLVIDKFRYGAFSCPAGALDARLSERSATMLVITGTLTNVCVESTAREAYMRGYRVIVVSDATAAATDREHNAALMNLRLNFADVRTTREVLGMVRRSRLPLCTRGAAS